MGGPSRAAAHFVVVVRELRRPRCVRLNGGGAENGRISKRIFGSGNSSSCFLSRLLACRFSGDEDPSLQPARIYIRT